MISPELMKKRYHADSYNCAHLVADAWRAETGEDIASLLRGFMRPKGQRSVEADKMRTFRKLDRPESPSIVVMRQGKNRLHVGMYLRGRILQIRQDGVTFLPPHLATMGYTRVRYYA